MSFSIRTRDFLTRHFLVILLSVWTFLFTASIAWNLYQNHIGTIAKAQIEASTIYRHNIAYRKWSTMHGGIYNKITNKNKDNPHLIFNLDKDDQSIAFSMIDPFQMTRQAYDVLHKDAPGLSPISHSVSLSYQTTQDPYDKPDPWEEQALINLKKGLQKEASTVDTINNAPYLRLIKPYVIDQGCMKCHTPTDYPIGTVRGAMSVAIPMQPYYQTEIKAKRTVVLTHLLLWLLGCLTIIKFSSTFNKNRIALLESEKKFRIVSEFAHNFEYWITADYQIAFISPSCLPLTGYSREEFLEQPELLQTIIHPDDADVYTQHIDHIDSKDQEGLDFRIIRKDGQVRWFSHSCSPININGEFLGRRGSSIDVTEHKDLEERLMRSNQLECLGQFAGGIAHDFNNVLSSINTFTHLLTDELKNSNSTAADYVKYIKIAAKLGKNLTSNLLSFGKRQIVKPQKTKINAIISNISDILRTLVDEDTNYVFQTSEDDWDIAADPHQIEQILINLCTNARDAMKTGGTITISSQLTKLNSLIDGSIEEIPPGQYMTLSVSDTGNGIDPQNIKKVCEPFFTTKSSAKGTGLGLAIIHTIIQQHKGYIDVSSTIGQRTTFTIFLPATEPDPSQDAHSSLPIPQSSPSIETTPIIDTNEQQTTDLDKPTILLADDDELIRKSLSIPLERAGYKVISAEDGKKAISLFLDNRNQIGLAILDVVLPHRNGKEIFDIIRKNKPSLKVIFISGYTDNIISDKILAEDGVIFLGKPIDIEEFTAVVDQMTGSRKS